MLLTVNISGVAVVIAGHQDLDNKTVAFPNDRLRDGIASVLLRLWSMLLHHYTLGSVSSGWLTSSHNLMASLL